MDNTMNEQNRIIECDSHAEGGEHNVPATGHCKNPNYSGYNLCDECIAEYDSRQDALGHYTF